jgi:predicted RNA polymerase sigma factor
LIRRGLAALARAETHGGGAYTLQAEIAACHARAKTAAETDWARIAALYDLLERLQPSPVIELNRAVAVGMAYGPQAGLAIVEVLVDTPAMQSYHLTHAVRGDLLEKLGRREEARTAFERAAELVGNVRERQLMLERIRALAN